MMKMSRMDPLLLILGLSEWLVAGVSFLATALVIFGLVFQDYQLTNFGF